MCGSLNFLAFSVRSGIEIASKSRGKSLPDSSHSLIEGHVQAVAVIVVIYGASGTQDRRGQKTKRVNEPLSATPVPRMMPEARVELTGLRSPSGRPSQSAQFV